MLREQPATRFVRTLRLGGLKGLVVISAHWFSRELQINVEPKPALMHDFYGFPVAPLPGVLGLPAASSGCGCSRG